MIPRENALKTTLESGGIALGAAAISSDPRIVELLGDTGADFVWVDLEHGGDNPWDAAALEQLGRAAQVGGTELMVRLPGPDPFRIRKVLDTGVRSLIIPRIETADELEGAVEATRFLRDDEPGDRGLAPARANAWGGTFDGFVDREDDQVLLGAMIENETAVANLDDILSVSGLGFVFIGPGDLSVSVGRPMELNSPEVTEAIDTVEELCRAHKVPLAGIVVEGQDASTLLDRGYQLLTLGSDLPVLREAFEARFAAVDR